jgi:GNAT superfamily N-acetyltransferase
MFIEEFSGKLNKRRREKLEDEIREYLKTALPENNFIAYLAEFKKKPVGMGGLVVWSTPPGITSGRVGYILSMYTTPQFRGNGIGTEILHNLIKEAKELQLKFIHLHASNEGEGIYRKAGFREPENIELKLKLE